MGNALGTGRLLRCPVIDRIRWEDRALWCHELLGLGRPHTPGGLVDTTHWARMLYKRPRFPQEKQSNHRLLIFDTSVSNPIRHNFMDLPVNRATLSSTPPFVITKDHLIPRLWLAASTPKTRAKSGRNYGKSSSSSPRSLNGQGPRQGSRSTSPRH